MYQLEFEGHTAKEGDRRTAKDILKQYGALGQQLLDEFEVRPLRTRLVSDVDATFGRQCVHNLQGV